MDAQPVVESAEANAVEVSPLSKALVQIDGLATGLADLQRQYRGVIFEVRTPQGMKAAKAARLAIRQPRYRLEHTRKDAKRLIEAEAERITAALLEIEEPIHLQITTEETRRETERLAAIEAERVRVEAIQERITNDIRGAVARADGRNAAHIEATIRDLIAVVIDATFAEFKGQAEGARASTLFRLRQMHEAAQAREAETERLRIEREDIERVRVEQAAEAARLAKARAQLAPAPAEVAPVETQAETTRLAPEALKQEPRRGYRLAAPQRSELEVDAAPPARQTRTEIDESEDESRPTATAIVRVVAQSFGVTEATALAWLLDMFAINEKRAVA